MKTRKVVSVLLMAAMVASFAGCSVKENKPKVDEDDIEEFAVNYCDAILSASKRDLKKMSEESSSRYIEELSFTNITGDSSVDMVYDAWFNTLAYEITDIDFDDDDLSAEVEVTFKYADYDSFAFEESQYSYEWIDALENTDEVYEIDAVLQIEYDDIEESLFVKSPNIVMEKALGMFEESLDKVIPSNANLGMTAEWVGVNGDTISTTDTPSIRVTFSDNYNYYTDRPISVELLSSNGNCVDLAIMGYALADNYVITPDMFGLDELPEGVLTVYFYEADSSTSCSISINVESPVIEDGFSFPCATTYNEEMAGTFDDATGLYRNEYFNVQFAIEGETAPSSEIRDQFCNTLVSANLNPDAFILDNATSSVWIVATATFDESLGYCTAEFFAGPLNPICESNGVEYLASTQETEDYVYECYLIPGGDGMIVVYHYSYDMIPDNGAVMGTMSPIC